MGKLFINILNCNGVVQGTKQGTDQILGLIFDRGKLRLKFCRLEFG